MKNQKELTPEEYKELAIHYRERLMKTKITTILILINVVIWYFAITGAKTFYSDYFELLVKSLSKKTGVQSALAANVEPTDMKEWVLNEWDKVGQRDRANQIITCESKWNMNATNINTNGTFDASLYQWNSIHIKSGLMTFECLGDYKCQTQKAIEMWKKSGWSPWVCDRLIK